MDPLSGSNVELKVKGLYVPSESKFVVTGELLPASELIHHQLAALLDEKDVPEVEVDFVNDNNVLRLTVSFTHKTKNVAEEGHKAMLGAQDKVDVERTEAAEEVAEEAAAEEKKSKKKKA